jgi:flagellar biogenesis protein FliO
MEVFGGFMVMMSIISLFLAVVWLIMPFVVFAIKGKQDRTLEVLEAIEKRLTVIESALVSVKPAPLQDEQEDCKECCYEERKL